MQPKRKAGAIFGQVLRLSARGLKWLCVLIGGIILTSFTAGLIAVGFATYYIFWDRTDLPDIQTFVNFDVPQVGVVKDSKGRPIINLAKEYRLLIKPNEITLPTKAAFLSAEDKNFYSHKGIDRDAILRAAWVNIKHSGEASLRERRLRVVVQQGASTITDQMVGLYYREHIDSALKRLAKRWWGFLPRQYLKKMEELRLAVWLEEELIKPEYFGSKDNMKNEILARFLSYTYFRKVYGVKAASLYYFGKDFEHLDYAETALLAGIVKNPGLYAPTSNPPSNLFVQRQFNRRNIVLDLMVENGYLTQDRADEFKEMDLPVPEDKRDVTDAPSIVGDMFSELKGTGVNADRLLNGDVIIYSVSNLDIQKIANNALENGLSAFEDRHPESKGIIQGSVVVLRNSDAAILAEVGGRKVYNNTVIKYSDFNRARHSLRQPGSAFKPFVYLTAISEGWKLDDTVQDMPVTILMGNGKPPHIVQNYDQKYKGPVSLRRALAESRNAATIWLSFRVGGINNIIQTTKTLGVQTELQPYPTTAIGASEIRLIELANAYRAIASGISAKPYVIDEVVDNSGNLVYKATPDLIALSFEKINLDLIREGLRGTVRIPGGTAYSLTMENFPVDVMGKTGTTNELRDALFVGSTYGPDGITIAVRIGYDDNRPLGNGETGARAALPVFKQAMREIYAQNLVGLPPEFPAYIEESINNYVLNPR
ncbi:MAG: hypothetical protein A2655_04370 [Candidatus Yanofskybacteria bacterium RIFCSPHIGHO2_01_FULL_43_42]|uniref:peptidoglycan glycosyltransferase n=1 Tax=Candidatus Yanofskybacteria bacterium RIFCSPLOWO2_01_FULL_43_22 TaxID=1802695 RepID=A0A1F8GDA1_9BACT|nr:MAG: hypothetical protein A2655_04370 [Candidatus Yanofskybacteria bacterium RIFCSPHIGHO2_01_FULL_43_42]OGN13492.1 MAG: hypothetical protein A3D48_01930 [Candidatus Yanofskybacteria bacterium RIFCSPHIGHO2_02_FULL_43_17]OGN23347.1 MAG: hypothetical protein A3A13_04495 [Candidatus Yanofskybacteria bacterium RIFCSPLOWO2_01_FULL_43_22]